MRARTRYVLRSVEGPEPDRCVDIFRRADGSFGFEEYRRDPEDGRGWFPIGHHEHRRFPTERAAMEAAAAAVPWFPPE